MKSHRKNIITPILGIMIFAASTLTAQNEKKASVDIELKNKHLTLTSKFTVKANSKKELLHLLFAYKHLKTVVEGVCGIELVKNEKTSQLVRYTYAGKFWSLKSEFKRTLRGDEIIFNLLKVESTGILPLPPEKNSKGYYKVSKTGNHTFVVSFLQKSDVSIELLSGFYAEQIKTRTAKYLTKLMKYVNSHYHQEKNGQ